MEKKSNWKATTTDLRKVNLKTKNSNEKKHEK